MKRPQLSRRNKRREKPRNMYEFVFLWLAGPGNKNWKRWKNGNLLIRGWVEGTEREDAACRSRILILMDRLYRLDEMIKQGTQPDALFSTINESLRLYPSVPKVEPSVSPTRDWEELEAGRIREPKMALYILKDMLRLPATGWDLAERPLHVGRRKGQKAIQVLMQEWAALHLLKEMFQRAAGWPPQVRRCAICKNWFWGKRLWAKLCTAQTCKLTAKHQYQTSEVYKRQRKENRDDEIRRSKNWLTNPNARKEKKG
jgi:hypothetical protein